ncbi:MAG: hypothetical protein RI945_221 [Candidatus Parcubacteria bacterium]
MKDYIRKYKKSKYFLTNIVLLIVFLVLLISYFFYENKENMRGKLYDEKKDSQNYSTFVELQNSTSTNIATTTNIIATTSTTSNIYRKNGEYVKITDSCGTDFAGGCVRARTCPSLSCPSVSSLRDNMVLKTNGEIISSDGVDWYHIVFDEWRRFPDRIPADLYISSKYLTPLDSYVEKFIGPTKIKNTRKEIIIKLEEQKLYAYDDGELFMEVYISSGLDDLPTPRGTFQIYSKTPSRYMQGPLDGISDQYYDLPGVPWTMYFTYQGGAIHGAYWHDNFGSQWSHGCINLVPDEAEKLYSWADLGTKVIVKD